MFTGLCRRRRRRRLARSRVRDERVQCVQRGDYVALVEDIGELRLLVIVLVFH